MAGPFHYTGGGITEAEVRAIIEDALNGSNSGYGYLTTPEVQALIDAAIAAIVDSSPAALDTLNELAAALGDDANFATTVLNSLAGKSDVGHTHTASAITDFAEATQDVVGAMIVDSAEIDATYDDGSNNLSLAVVANSIAFGKLATMAAGIVGVAGPSTANLARINASVTGQALTYDGSSYGFRQLALGAFADTIITPAKLNVSADVLAMLNSANDAAIIAGLGLYSGTTRPSFLANRNNIDQTGVADVTYTKVQYNNEVTDVGGFYDAATNYRWTPPAGPVLIFHRLQINGTYAAVQQSYAAIYKNGALFATGYPLYSQIANFALSCVGCIDIANGTDYYEAYGYVNLTSGTGDFEGATQVSDFSGVYLG